MESVITLIYKNYMNIVVYLANHANRIFALLTHHPAPPPLTLTLPLIHSAITFPLVELFSHHHTTIRQVVCHQQYKQWKVLW